MVSVVIGVVRTVAVAAAVVVLIVVLLIVVVVVVTALSAVLSMLWYVDVLVDDVAVAVNLMSLLMMTTVKFPDCTVISHRWGWM